MKLLKHFLLAISLMVVFALTPTSFADEGENEVDVVVKGSASIVIPDATVYVYFWDTTAHSYVQQPGEHISNSAGRVNNIPVPYGTYFYALAEGPSGEFYARSNAGFDNLWYSQEGGISNVETGSVRSTNYVHVYPGETPMESGEDPGDPEEEVESTDAGASAAGAVSDDPPPGVEMVELDVTVYDADLNPVPGATVTIHPISTVDGDTEVTDSSGETDGLMIEVGKRFYASAVDASGNKYGGPFDWYHKRSNYWTTFDGEILENTFTGLTRLLYLDLYPEEITPGEGEVEVEETEEPDCGGFPDALYENLTPEECNALKYVKDQGIFTGTAEGLIEHERPINRAEVTKVMIEAYDLEQLSDLARVSTFPDVSKSPDVWFSKYVYSARHLNVVGGYPDGLFRPTNTINRVELLRIYLEASGFDTSAVPTHMTFWRDIDVEPGTQWFIGYANTAFMYELLDHNGNLIPGQPMTRMDVIKLLYRASL